MLQAFVCSEGKLSFFWSRLLFQRSEEALTQQRRLDSVLSIYAPDGSLLQFNDDDNVNAFYVNSGLVNLELPADGVYRVVVGSFGGLSRGAYTLSFQRGEE